MKKALGLNPKQRFGEGERPSDRDIEIYYRNRICFESVRKLAPEFGLTPQRISQIASETAPWYLAQHVIEDEAMRKEQSAQLVRLAEEAAEQWERSKLDIVASKDSKEEVTGEKAHDKTKEETIRQPRYGDPRLADVIRGCLKDLRDIWGLDAPKKSETRNVEEFETREVVYGRVAAKLEKLIQPQEN